MGLHLGILTRGLLALAGLVALAPTPAISAQQRLAIDVGKILTVDFEDSVVNNGTILVEDGRITYVGPRRPAPEGFERVDATSLWASPGLVDLHSHSVGTGDINDMVMPVNPELSVRPSYIASNPRLRLACAAGVTTIFGIPGSGTSIGGFGGLWKAKTEARYGETVLRYPGGMKSAFNFNPQRGNGDLGRTWAGLSWTVEKVNDMARAVARGDREEPLLADLGKVLLGDLPVLVHCASAEGVAGVVRLWKLRETADVVVSHGSWDGHMAAKFCAENGVPVNHGPTIFNFTTARREGRINGGAESFVSAGVPLFSLNTDAPVIPQEEFFLQGAISARLGAPDTAMLRALTANAAQSFQIGNRVGSLVQGLDADIVLTTGDPMDPRSCVERVYIDGELQYERERDGQWY